MHHCVNSADCTANTSFEIEELLIQNNARLNITDNRGRIPLHYAFVKIGKPFDSSKIDPIETVSSLLAYMNNESLINL